MSDVRDGEFEEYGFTDGTAVRFQRRIEQLDDGVSCPVHANTLCFSRVRLLVNEVYANGVNISPGTMAWGVTESRLEAEVLPDSGRYICPSCLGLPEPIGQSGES